MYFCCYFKCYVMRMRVWAVIITCASTEFKFAWCRWQFQKICIMNIFKNICLLLLQLSLGRSWWLFSGKDEHPETDVGSSDSQQKERRLAALPFEINSAEQRFLAEAQQFLDLSPLEQCQHKVMLNSLS